MTAVARLLPGLETEARKVYVGGWGREEESSPLPLAQVVYHREQATSSSSSSIKVSKGGMGRVVHWKEDKSRNAFGQDKRKVPSMRQVMAS